MDENMSVDVLNIIMRFFERASFIESMGHNLESVALFQQMQDNSRLLARQFQVPQLQLPQLSTPSEPLFTPSTPSPTSSSPNSLPHNTHQESTAPLASPIHNNDLNRNVSLTGKTYSDCEKKHFLDVAYENSWGTTVAANKFVRVWGKGPTRRMFYWWREQFKKEYEREQKVLDVLLDRKREISSKLIDLKLGDETSTDHVQEALQQTAAIDLEISNLAEKKRKKICSITGVVCVHGDGLQEETATKKKRINPFFCDYCKMPFQKESTCYVHMTMCQTRFVVCSEKNEPVVLEGSSREETLSSMNVLRESDCNTELRDLAEKLIAGLAACSSASDAVPLQ